MNKRELDLLEEIYGFEIEAALGTRISDVHPARSKIAKRLEADGHIRLVTRDVAPQCRLTGWVLTELGRMTYCFSERCEESRHAER